MRRLMLAMCIGSLICAAGCSAVASQHPSVSTSGSGPIGHELVRTPARSGSVSADGYLMGFGGDGGVGGTLQIPVRGVLWAYEALAVRIDKNVLSKASGSSRLWAPTGTIPGLGRPAIGRIRIRGEIPEGMSDAQVTSVTIESTTAAPMPGSADTSVAVPAGPVEWRYATVGDVTPVVHTAFNPATGVGIVLVSVSPFPDSHHSLLPLFMAALYDRATSVVRADGSRGARADLLKTRDPISASVTFERRGSVMYASAIRMLK